jgi:hypothetical protein
MTTKTLSTYVAAGYTLAAQYDTLDITGAGGVGGSGVLLNHLASLDNDGTIKAAGSANGVHATAGGTIVNGSANYPAASISGYSGVFAQNVATTVTNFGTINGAGQFGDGVFLTAGGRVVNGAASDTAAYIKGVNSGVSMGGSAAATVTNFGTIFAVNYIGVDLAGGGKVTNGSSGDTTARIVANQSGVTAAALATVKNFGTVFGATANGVDLDAGGTAINGTIRDTTASITGKQSGVTAAALAKVTNFGSIIGNDNYGVFLKAGGSVTNGAALDQTALVNGLYGAVDIDGAAGTVANFGTLAANNGHLGIGVYLQAGGSLTNGAADDTGATIDAVLGVLMLGVATVTNFGTISGSGGRAINFASTGEVLAVEAGSAFYGSVLGGGGTLVLDTGAGTLTGLLAGGTVTVSGSMAATIFSNFDTVKIGAAATFSTSGAVSIAAGQSVVDAGLLTLGASKITIANAGTIETLGGTVTAKGRVTGTGKAIVDGGTLDFKSSFNQAVTFVGGVGTLELAQSQSYTATISGFSKTGGTSLDLVDIAFIGSGEATFSGTKAGGSLTVTDGTHTAHINLIGNYLSSTWIAESDGHGGVVVHDPPGAAAAAAPHAFIAAMAGMGPGGAAGLEPTHAWRRHAPPILLGPHAAIA